MDSRFDAISNEIKTAEMIVVLGPTASGKTRLAISLAQQFNGEIISADSRQVYKNMDIGTGKDLDEYKQAGVKYHLIDLIPAGEKYNLHQFQLDYKVAFDEIKDRRKKPILCGGSGLYLEAALSPKLFTQIPENQLLKDQLRELPLEELKEIWFKEYEKVSTYNPDLSTHKRTLRAIEIAQYLKDNPDFKFENRGIQKAIIIGLAPDLQQRRNRIEARLNARLQNGMIEEVETLIKTGISVKDLVYYGLEYKFITLYLIGELSYVQMKQRLLIAIQQFAKRQMTYFRKLEKDGFIIHWFKPEDIKPWLLTGE